MFNPLCDQPKLLFLAICCISVFVLFPLSATASQSVKISWDSGGDSEFVSYRIYYGTVSGSYDNEIDVDNTNVTSITGLADGVTYYFAAAGVDDQGNESANSAEVSFTTAAPVPATLTPVMQRMGIIGFNVSGGDGAEYAVQTSTDLVNWTSLLTNTAPFTFYDVCLPTVPQCFYRTVCVTP